MRTLEELVKTFKRLKLNVVRDFKKQNVIYINEKAEKIFLEKLKNSKKIQEKLEDLNVEGYIIVQNDFD